MNSRISLTIFCFLSFAARAEMSEYVFEFKNERYSVFVLNGDGQPQNLVPKDHPEYGIRKSAYKLAKIEYENLGFKSNPELLSLMTASRSLVLITEHGKSENAYQMLSIAKGESLPIEQRLRSQNIDLNLYTPREYGPAPKIGLEAEGDTSRIINKNVERDLNVQTRVSRFYKIKYRSTLQKLEARQGNVELKSFVKSGNSPRGFTPLLSHVMSAHGLLLESGNPIPIDLKNDVLSKPRNVPYGFSGHHTSVPHAIFDHGDGVPSPFVNKNYRNLDIIAVSFRPATTRYYTKQMGFEVVQEIEDPQREGQVTTVLRRKVKSFLENNHIKFMEGREGEILKKGQLSFVKKVQNVEWSSYSRIRPFSLERFYPSPNQSCTGNLRTLIDPGAVKARDRHVEAAMRYINMLE